MATVFLRKHDMAVAYSIVAILKIGFDKGAFSSLFARLVTPYMKLLLNFVLPKSPNDYFLPSHGPNILEFVKACKNKNPRDSRDGL